MLKDVILGARESNTKRISSHSEMRSSEVYKRDEKQNSLEVWREKKVFFYSWVGQGSLWERSLEGWVEVFFLFDNIYLVNTYYVSGSLPEAGNMALINKVLALKEPSFWKGENRKLAYRSFFPFICITEKKKSRMTRLKIMDDAVLHKGINRDGFIKKMTFNWKCDERKM